MNRTLQTILSIPAAAIAYVLSSIICMVLPYLMELSSMLSSMRGGGQDLYFVEFVYNWIILFLIYSIFPVVSANVAMNFLLENEERHLMSLMPRVLLATFGVLFFLAASAVSIALGNANMQIMSGYALSIVSFIVVPIVLNRIDK